MLATQNNHAAAAGNMGLAHAGLGERDRALACLDRALEIDPRYELAAVNRMVIAGMKDGERLPPPGKSVHYQREFRFGGKSYAEEIRRRFEGRD